MIAPRVTAPLRHGMVSVFTDPADLARAAAEALSKAVDDAVSNRGQAFIALSGGTTPSQMGELLAAAPYRDEIPWASVDVFWGDERWVPLSDPESNAGVARRTFLDRVSIPAGRIHPWPTDSATPETAATTYASTVAGTVPGNPLPRFDLVFLGMGDDGHTASLFPRTAALAERRAIAVANPIEKLGETRLTLTVRVLNAARQVVFLVSGNGKAETLAAVLEGGERPLDLPAQSIRPTDGRLAWFVDQAAAARLTVATTDRDG